MAGINRGDGVSGTDSMLYRSLLQISTMLYRRADHIVVVTPAFKKHMAKHFDCPSDKISVVANGVDLDMFKKAERDYVPARNGKFVVSFIGTIGNAHGLDVILRAAEMLRESDPNVVFRIVGDGAERGAIEESIKKSGYSNLEILPQQPRSKVPALIWDSDVCLVLLKQSEVFRTVIPTKMLEFMACGRPVILGVEGQAREILDAARGGIGIPPENAEALAAAVVTLQTQSRCGRATDRTARAISRKTSPGKHRNPLRADFEPLDGGRDGDAGRTEEICGCALRAPVCWEPAGWRTISQGSRVFFSGRLN